MCPNPSCGRSDRLMLVERVTTWQAAEFYDVGVTYPEVERQQDSEPAIHPGEPELIGLRCDECHWSYTGPNPLARLVKATL